MKRRTVINRRGFLKRTAITTLGAIGAAHGIRPRAVRAAPYAPIPPHGGELRGMNLVLQSPQAEGRFGRMFSRLPGFVPSSDLTVQQALINALGTAMEELPKVVSPNPSNAEFDANDFPHDNPILPAGFTFLAQFIDHDFTFDQTDLDLAQQDPNATSNFRSTRFDLNSVYGAGPAKRPDLYDPTDPAKFRIETYEDSSIPSWVTPSGETRYSSRMCRATLMGKPS